MSELFLAIALIYLVVCQIVAIILRVGKEISPVVNQQKTVGVIIPFRNEAANLERLIPQLLKQETKHKLTFYFVNDHSTDSSKQVVSLFSDDRIILIDNEANGKKEALLTALKRCEEDVCVLIDADVQVYPNWLDTLVNPMVSLKCDWVAGRVKPASCPNLLTMFQILEWDVLQRLTAFFFKIKKPILCNSANLAFANSLKQEAIEALKKQTTSSGDDMSLLATFNKVKAHGKYGAEEAIVYIDMPERFNDFVQQKLRWMKKMQTKMSYTSLVGVFMLLINVMLIFSFFIDVKIGICFSILKFIADSLLLGRFKMVHLPFWILHQIYPLLLMVIQPFVVVKWKGRIVKA